MRCHRAELGRQRPRRRRPDVPDRQRRPAPATGAGPWRAPRLASSRSPLAESTGESLLALLGRPGEQVGLQQLVLGRGRRRRPRWRSRPRPAGRTPPPSPSPSMSNAPRPATWKTRSSTWDRQNCVVGAAEVLVALLLLHQRGPARRAGGGHLPLPRALRPQAEHRPDDLGDHVAGLAQHDRVARPDVLALHLVGVVQGRPLDGRAGDPRRLHHPERRHPPGAAGVDLDRDQPGVDLLGRVLERDRPARRPRRRPEPTLQRRPRRP